MVSADKLAQAGFKYIGTPYSTMDCQAFVERCLKDCGCDLNLAGSNAWFRKMTWTGSPEDCKAKFGRIPAGAFLFILKQDGKEPEKYKKDGIGNASHIGLKTGTGKGAIHSSGSRSGVCESEFHDKTIQNGGWNRIGLWTEVSYGADIDAILDGGGDTPAPDPQPEPEPIVTTATVTAPTGGTVKMRAKPSTSCGLYWDVPVFSLVDVIEKGDEWSRIRWTGRTGFMMSKFLNFNTTILWTAHIPHLTEDQARALLARYPGSWMISEEGGAVL